MNAGLLRSRPVVLVLGVLLLAGSWEVYGQVSRQQRFSPAVQEAVRRGEPLDVVVTLGFAPEHFHIKLFQGYGTVSAVQSNGVTIRQVPPERLNELGKSYWISRIELDSP